MVSEESFYGNLDDGRAACSSNDLGCAEGPFVHLRAREELLEPLGQSGPGYAGHGEEGTARPLANRRRAGDHFRRVPRSPRPQSRRPYPAVRNAPRGRLRAFVSRSITALGALKSRARPWLVLHAIASKTRFRKRMHLHRPDEDVVGTPPSKALPKKSCDGHAPL